jgi:uncharacterized protein (TIGR02646 family)
MVELQHRAVPTPALAAFVIANPAAPVAAFDSLAFRPVKDQVKADLHEDQDGLCVYCESALESTEGQVEHIKPKAGDNGHPHLCFSYTNYAHSCINNRTCGQKKGNGLLPIEPGPGCNADWTLSTTGSIEPRLGLTRARAHQVRQTRDMLGLNRDAGLVAERERWLRQALTVLQQAPAELGTYLQQIPFRHILATAV